MLSDEELKNYLQDLNLLDSGGAKERALSPADLLQELTETQKNPPKEEEQKKERPRSFFGLLSLATFLLGIVVGLIFSNLQKSPLEKMTAELQKTLDALEKWETTHLNPPINNQEIIEMIETKKNDASLT